MYLYTTTQLAQQASHDCFRERENARQPAIQPPSFSGLGCLQEIRGQYLISRKSVAARAIPTPCLDEAWYCYQR